MLTIRIFYKLEPHYPAIYACDQYAAWQLWWIMKDSEAILKIEIWDQNFQLNPKKGIKEMFTYPQFRIT